jgi:hypothetical protein
MKHNLQTFALHCSYSDFPDVTLDVWAGCYSVCTCHFREYARIFNHSFLQGNWQDDVSTFTKQNASVIVSGPFYITQQNGAPNTPHFNWDQMYSTDLHNFSGNDSHARSLVKGAEVCVRTSYL